MSPVLEPAHFHSPKSGGAITKISRIHASTINAEQFFEQYQKPGYPVIITGLLAAEPNWSLEYLQTMLGDRPFPIRHYGRDRYTQDKRDWQSMGSGVDTRVMPFSQYVERLKSGEAHTQDLYLGKATFNDTPLAQLPTLQHAETQLGLNPVTPLYLWVGAAGHTTCLHYDPFDGTLMQLHGSKHIILFPPSQLYNLYPFSILNHLQHGLKRRSTYSQVYPDRPDFDAFPKLRQALQYRQDVVLNPGEMLFIPAGWWHEISTVGDSAIGHDAIGHGVVCSVNRFWQVRPVGRSLRLWSKWRAHLASVYALPHILWNLLLSLRSHDRVGELRKLFQRL